MSPALRTSRAVSARMKLIKGKGNRSTELAFRAALRRAGLTGWRANYAAIPGSPDFAFPARRIAIFVHGCFWHGCRRCRRNLKPAANARYWADKIDANRRRDRRKARQLRALGWRVMTFWEHRIVRDADGCARELPHAVGMGGGEAKRRGGWTDGRASAILTP